jgi:hypothetical protein
MISNVATRNVATGANEDILFITEGVQIGDHNECEERGSNRNKGEDNL